MKIQIQLEGTSLKYYVNDAEHIVRNDIKNNDFGNVKITQSVHESFVASFSDLVFTCSSCDLSSFATDVTTSSGDTNDDTLSGTTSTDQSLGSFITKKELDGTIIIKSDDGFEFPIQNEVIADDLVVTDQWSISFDFKMTQNEPTLKKPSFLTMKSMNDDDTDCNEISKTFIMSKNLAADTFVLSESSATTKLALTGVNRTIPLNVWHSYHVRQYLDTSNAYNLEYSFKGLTKSYPLQNYIHDHPRGHSNVVISIDPTKSFNTDDGQVSGQIRNLDIQLKKVPNIFEFSSDYTRYLETGDNYQSIVVNSSSKSREEIKMSHLEFFSADDNIVLRSEWCLEMTIKIYANYLGNCSDNPKLFVLSHGDSPLLKLVKNSYSDLTFTIHDNFATQKYETSIPFSYSQSLHIQVKL